MIHTWILVLFLAGSPYQSVGPFASVEECVARGQELLSLLEGSAWEPLTELKCREKAVRRADREV